MAKRAPEPKRPYHHGDLRAALLSAAEAELAESGVASFSLRACARRAGVSHAAPAHHFGDVAGLLAALSAVGYERLALRIRRETGKADAGGREPLVAAILAQVRFALDAPDLYRLMTRATPDEALVATRADAMAAAAEPIGAYYKVADAASDAKTSARVTGAWALSQGLAELALAGGLGAPASATRKLGNIVRPLAEDLFRKGR